MENNELIMTLDAGGTNLVFSAICRGEEIVEPVHMPSSTDDLEGCLQTIVAGFEAVKRLLPAPPTAISFAFPGPADYEGGIIGGNVPNLKAFRGGVALGPFLEEHFGIPVFINNDGNLFAYGEALSGMLPEINARLEAAGNPKRYRNLLGLTLGTGFGSGVVINGELLRGDNQVGGCIWCQSNKKYPEYIVEESVSIRAVRRVYAERSGDTTERTPKEIFEIAEGIVPGDREAAVAAFAELGEMAGYAIAAVITVVDGLVVIGGGLSGAAKYILPSLMKELRTTTGMMDGTRFSRLQMPPYNLEDPDDMAAFLENSATKVTVPGTDREVNYDTARRIGIAISRQGTSRSIALGAYWFAINQLNKSKK